MGALLGHAADAQARGRTPRRILVWAPLLLAAVLLDPTMLLLLLRQGYGGGSLMVVATALSAGYALTHRRLSMPTVLCGLVAMSGLAAIAFMATLAAPLATPRGVWVCVFGLSLMLVLCLASALPHRHLPPLGSWAYVGIGGLCGLAWASGLRSFMAAVVGPASQVTWVNTVVWILLVGAIVGALLGYAARLRSTGLPRPALTAAPLLFAAVLLPGLLHPAIDVRRRHRRAEPSAYLSWVWPVRTAWRAAGLGQGGMRCSFPGRRDPVGGRRRRRRRARVRPRHRARALGEPALSLSSGHPGLGGRDPPPSLG